MSLDLLDRDPHDPNPGIKTRIVRRILGDPRKAPTRLIGAAIFVLIGVIVAGVWAVIQTETTTSSSSYWFVRLVGSIVNTMWVLVPVAIYLFWRYIGVLRKRYAESAAEITGWLPESIEHLSDEMRSTDRTTRVIATTDHSFEEIRSNVDAALRGEPHEGEVVDYYGRYESNNGDGQPEAPASDDSDLESRLDELSARETELIEEYNRKTERIDDLLDDALGADLDLSDPSALDDRVSMYDLMDGGGQDAVDEADQLLEECEAIEQELESVRDELAAVRAEIESEIEPESDLDVRSRGHDDVYALPEPEPETDDDHSTDRVASDRQSIGDVWANADGLRAKGRAVVGHCYRRAVDVAIASIGWIVGLIAGVLGTIANLVSGSPGDEPEDEDEVPWKVRFAEELKHLVLDLNAGLHSDDLLWKFGLPAFVTFVSLLILARLWVHPILYIVFIAIAILVGLFTFWVSKKRRSRRLQIHRQPEEWSYWDDAAGRVKTVETADVECYMGWLPGRRYVSYDREEFITEFSLRLYQLTHDEKVSPSVLEQYARNIAQMKPNLRGHLEQTEKPAIQQEIKTVVEDAPEQVIDKAGLAMEVIEHPHEDKRLSSDLGHDPRLVADEYRWLVEEGHVLEEIDVEFEDASGRTTTKTLVYPAKKKRLPDMEALHSQFSDRFTGSHGDPYYNLPECNPTEDLRGFVPSPRAAQLFETGGV
ncbi:hypothetical protein [Halosolutus gelatinilyticus]|uniref:hypothetical protein n=1 Tax=Halosolutus gelatinilyticus TaxID=2931975 RepID=UPI001FF5C589|nr:hypothetical protein [Halosolutus gelatinilyticus]